MVVFNMQHIQYSNSHGFFSGLYILFLTVFNLFNDVIWNHFNNPLKMK